MHRTTEIYNYYKELTKTSPNISMKQVGTTEEGRPIQLVIIGNEDAMKRLDHYKKQLELLADPRKINVMDVARLSMMQNRFFISMEDFTLRKWVRRKC